MEQIKNKLTDDVSIEKGLSTFLNPYSYYVLRNDMATLNKFDRIYCDGFLFVIMARFLKKKITRVSFDMTSLAPLLFVYADVNKKTIAVVGGVEGVSEKFVKKYKKKYKNVDFVYNHSGFFNDNKNEEKIIEDIINISPDIVIVGMGSGPQEHFLIDLVDQGWSGIGYTCGGFLHQSISNEKDDYYPFVVNKLNFRWLYRIYKEPKLWKRYFFVYPKAIALFFKDVLIKNKIFID